MASLKIGYSDETCRRSSYSSFTVGPVGTPTVGTAASRLIVPPCFRVSLVSARRAARTDIARDLWQRKGEIWAKNGQLNLAYTCDFHGNFKDFFTCCKTATWDRRLYFPSEGRRAEDFFARKIRRLRPGLNLRTWYQRPAR
jgi:hypothetical protein